jgi:hypothetical protein
MLVLRVQGLPEGALAAAAAFYAEWLKPARRFLNPSHGAEPVMLVFPPADHTHRAWRLAAVQNLARECAPQRINAAAAADDAALASVLAYLDRAPGLTGQYLPLDDDGAGIVIDQAL